MNYLRPKGEDGELSKEDMTLWMERIYALGYVDRVFYQVDGNTLKIDVSENNAAQLRAGLNYNTDTGITLGLLANISTFGATTKNTIVKIEASEYPTIALKRFTSYSFGSLKLLGVGEVKLDYSPLHIYSDDDKVSEIESRTLSLSLSLGTVLWDRFIAGLALEYKDVKNSYREGDRSFNELLSHEDYISPSAFILLDNRNKPYFANRGLLGVITSFSGHSPSGDNVDYRGSSYEVDGHIPLTEKLTLNLSSSGGKITGDSIPGKEHFKLGGLRNDLKKKYHAFYGMNTMREYADEFVMASGGLQYQFRENLYLVGRYNVLTFTNQILESRSEQSLWDDYAYGYGGGIGWDTFLGPMEFILTNDVDGSGAVFHAYMGYEF